MSEPRGPMLIFDYTRHGGVYGAKSLGKIDSWHREDSPVGLWRIIDVAGHLWVVDSWEVLGFLKPWSPLDLLRRRPTKVRLHASDHGEITLAEAQAMIGEFWRKGRISECWSEIGLDDAPAIAAKAPNVSKLVVRFYGSLK